MKREINLLFLLLLLVMGKGVTAQTSIIVVDGNPYEEDFEGSTIFSFENNTSYYYTNQWCIGTAASHGGQKGLYISDDNGATNTYQQNENSMVFAYVPIVLGNGKHQISYDWRGKGDRNNAYLRVALVPCSEGNTSPFFHHETPQTNGFGPQDLPTRWIALDGGSQLAESLVWRSEMARITISGGSYYLVFVWRTNSSNSFMNPAAGIDNVRVEKVNVFVPEQPVASNITAQSATITWTDTIASTWNIHYKKTTQSEWNTISALSQKEYTLTGLDSGAEYEVQVQAVDDGQQSTWTASTVFHTAVMVSQGNPYVEDFEGSTLFQFSNRDVLGAKWYIGTAAHNGTGSTKGLYISDDDGATNSYINSYSIGTTDYAYVQFSLENGRYDIAYDWRCRGHGEDDFMRVAVVPASTNFVGGSLPSGFSYNTLPTGWIAADGGSQLCYQLEWTTKNVSLTLTNAGDYYLVFVWHNHGGFYYDPPAAVDNIRVEKWIITTPTELAISNITTNSAKATWQDTDASAWNLRYKKTSQSEWNTISALSQKEYTLTGLDSGTEYEVQVQAVEDDQQSAWTASVTFCTKFAVDINHPYMENFEGSTLFQFANGNTGNKWYIGTAACNGSGTKGLYISNDDGNTNAYVNTASIAYAYVPITLEAGKHEISYDWKCNGESSYDYLRVVLVSASVNLTGGSAPYGFSYNSLPQGWIALDGGSGLNLSQDWSSKTAGLTISDEGDYYLVFVWRNNGSQDYNPPAAIDNILVAKVNAFTPSQLVVSDITGNSAKATWTDNDASAWNLRYKKTSESTWNTINDLSQKEYTFSNLDCSSEYEVQVQATGSDGQSAWTASVTFCTKFAVDINHPYMENFEGSTLFQFANGNTSNKWYIGTAAYNGSGTKGLYISNDNGNTNAYVNTASIAYAYVPITLEAGKHEISYDWKCKGESSADYMRVALVPASVNLTGGSAPSGFSYNSLPTNWMAADGGSGLILSQDWSSKTAGLTISGEGDYYLVFVWRNDGSQNYNPPAAIDNILVAKVNAFTPSQLVVSDITGNSAKATWTDNDASAWNLRYKKTSESTWTVTEEPVTVREYTLTGLDGSTEYEVQVQATGSDGQSAWTASAIFNTNLIVDFDHPYAENFEGSTLFLFANGTATNKWYIGTAAHNGTGSTKGLYISNNNGSSNDYNKNAMSTVYAYVPINLESGNYVASYDWICNGESTLDFLRVALVPASTTLAGGQTVPCNYFHVSLPEGWIALDGGSKLNLSSSWSRKTITLTLTDANAGDYYLVFAWRNDSSAGDNPPAAIDNISLAKVPAFPPSQLTVSNVMGHSATVRWQDADASAWNIRYKKTSESTWIVTEEPVTVREYTLTGLDGSTEYEVQVQSTGSDGQSEWTASAFFNTNLVVDFDHPYVEDFEGLTQFLFANGSVTNKWYIGTAAYNGTGSTKGLYISNDNGTSNAYTYNSLSMVYAYVPIALGAGDYQIHYDWKCNGEQNYDYMRVALVPASTNLTAGTALPCTNFHNTLPSGWIALDGGSKLNLSSAWTSKTVDFTITTAGDYNLVFAWRNDGSSGSTPPAAVDNISLSQKRTYTVTYDANGATSGTVPDDPNSPYLENASVTVIGNTGNLKKTGCRFIGWNTNADGSGIRYAPSQTFQISSDIVLYAEWAFDPHLHVTHITKKSALVEWTLGNGYMVTNWNLQYKPHDADNWTTVNGLTASTMYYALEDLSNETLYDVQLYAVFEDASMNCWSDIIFFSTSTMVNVGTSSGTHAGIPTSILSEYSLSQQIYTAEELGRIGYITSIAFYNSTSTVNRPNVDIYLVETTKEYFESNSDWVQVTNEDRYYTGNVEFVNQAFGQQIILDKPFKYDGDNNVCLVVHDKSGSANTSSIYFRVFNTEETSSIFTNGSQPNSADPFSLQSTGSRVRNKNCIQLVFADVPEPKGFAASGSTTTTATLVWTPGAEETEWELQCIEADGEWENAQSATATGTYTYTFSDLEPGVTYDARIRAVADGDYSNWTYTSFVTECTEEAKIPVSFIMRNYQGTGWNGTIRIYDNDLRQDLDTIALGNGLSEQTVTINACPGHHIDLSWDGYSDNYPYSIDAVIDGNVVFSMEENDYYNGELNGFTVEEPLCPASYNLTAVCESDEAVLTWNGTEGEEYLISYKQVGSEEWLYIDLDEPLTATSYTLQHLIPSFNYKFQVISSCGDGYEASYSVPCYFSVPMCPEADRCTFTFNLYQSQDDWWYGNRLLVREANTHDVIGYVEIADGESVPKTVEMEFCQGTNIELVWYDNYLDERCSFEVLDGNGELVAWKEFDEEPGDGYVFNTMEVVCGSCKVPRNLQASNIGTESATLSWTPGNEETAWNLQFRRINALADLNNWTGVEVIPMETTSITIDTLSPLMDYQFRVQAVCGEEEESIWSRACKFSTFMCEPEYQVQYTFVLGDSYGDGWNGATLEMVDVSTGSTLETMTVNGSTYTASMMLCEGVQFALIWHKGDYDNECSVKVKNCSGNTIYFQGTMSDYSEEETLLVFTASCIILCDPADQCTYTFNMQDKYNDGWNGASLEVKDVETNITIASMIVDGGNNNNTITLPLCNGRQVAFVWHQGDSDGECSFQVYDGNDNDNPVVWKDPDTELGEGAFLIGTVDCESGFEATPVVQVIVNGEVKATLNATVGEPIDLTPYIPAEAPTDGFEFYKWYKNYGGYNIYDEYRAPLEDCFNGTYSPLEDEMVAIIEAMFCQPAEKAYLNFFSLPVDDTLVIVGNHWDPETGTDDYYGLDGDVNPTLLAFDENWFFLEEWDDANQQHHSMEDMLWIVESTNGGFYLRHKATNCYLAISDGQLTYAADQNGAHIFHHSMDDHGNLLYFKVDDDTHIEFENDNFCVANDDDYYDSDWGQYSNVRFYSKQRNGRHFTNRIHTYGDNGYLESFEGVHVIEGDVQAAPLSNEDEYWSLGLIIIRDGGVLTGSQGINNRYAEALVIEDGGQLIHRGEVVATVEKNITGYGAGNANTRNGWNFIATPIDEGTEVSTIQTESAYDLYRYDEPSRFWLDTDENRISTLDNSTGYLYANEEDVTLQFKGLLYTNSNVGKTLSCQAEGDLAGFNLIGNPYAYNLGLNDIYFDSDGDHQSIESIYVIDGTRIVVAQNDTAIVKPCEGFFVKALEDEAYFVFAPNRLRGLAYSSMPTPDLKIEVAKAERGAELLDRAYLNFNGARNVEKLVLDKNTTRLSLVSEGKDYAALSASNEGTMPLSFEAVNEGTYTLTVSAERTEATYLHLLDKLTGADIDLLESGSYTFTATSSDDAMRFEIVFKTK